MSPRTTSEIADRLTPYRAASARCVGRSTRAHASRMFLAFRAVSFADPDRPFPFGAGRSVVRCHGFTHARSPHRR